MPRQPKVKRPPVTLRGVKKRQTTNPNRLRAQAEQSRRERQLSRYNDRIYVFGPQESEAAFLGHGLILSFNLFDLWGDQHAKMLDTFRYMKCSVLTCNIDSEGFQTALEKFLDRRFRRPRLIWIHCHGGDTPNGLTLYAGSKSNASMLWSDLVKIIAPAEVDVLTILSSCHAAAAYIPRVGKGRMYAKELIALSSWNEFTYPNILFDPTFRAMKKWFDEAGESRLTAENLYQCIASGIRHVRLANTKEWNMYVDYWANQRDGGRYGHSVVEENIAKGTKSLENIKRYYTHPIYTKRYVDWEEGMLAALGLSKREERSWNLSRPVPRTRNSSWP